MSCTVASCTVASCTVANVLLQCKSPVRVHIPLLVVFTAAITVSLATPLSAQEQLVTRRSAGLGVSAETIQFGSGGLRQYNFVGLDSARVTGVSQVSTPITTAWSVTDAWRVDMTALYARATVNYRDAGNSADRRTATLSGVSDLRVRATGTLIQDLLVVTAGVNVPTGRTSLSPTEFGVLRITAAPGLGMGSTPVGAGASGTLGVVVARRAGPWAMAMGGSYEYRGTYQPVAALIAGAPSADFRPGGVLRGSVTADRIVGAHRLTVSLAADVFSNDVLQSSAPSGTGAPAQSASTTVRLGPVISGDVQMEFAAPRFRQLLAYSALRYRAPFSRDGNTVDNSSGQYFDGGVRAALSMGPHRDLIFGADTRLHSGLGVDQGLPTSGVASGSISAGVEYRKGQSTVQPYLRAQTGVLRQRGTGPGAPSQSFQGFGIGLVAVSRF